MTDDPKITTKITDTDGANYVVFVKVQVSEYCEDIAELRGEGYCRHDAITNAIKKVNALIEGLKKAKTGISNQ